MAEPLRNFDEHKQKPATTKPLVPVLSETLPGEFLGSPSEVRGKSQNATEHFGSKVGEAIGNLNSRIQSGLRVLYGKSHHVGEAIGDITNTPQHEARPLSQNAPILMGEFRRNAYRRLQKAKAASQRAMNEHPIESLVAIGGVALVTGFLLRIWRSNGD
jgi:hypothetical protein